MLHEPGHLNSITGTHTVEEENLCMHKHAHTLGRPGGSEGRIWGRHQQDYMCVYMKFSKNKYLNISISFDFKLLKKAKI